MGHSVRALTAACVLAAAGCTGSEQGDQAARAQNANHGARWPSQAERAEKTSEPRLLLDGGGLVLEDRPGAGRKIAFGSPASTAVAAASEMYGRPLSVETLTECGAGPLQVSRFSGLTIAAQDGKFAGWSLDERDKPPLATTAAGIGIGSSRRELERSQSVETFESSLGQEFTADGFAGLLNAKSESAKITNLWAGATCIMR
jgi:hypothetical protein